MLSFSKIARLTYLFAFCIIAPSFAAESPFVTPKLSKGVSYFHDVEIGRIGDVMLKMDIATPAVLPSSKPSPVVVFIHGGGWRSGNKNRMANSLAGAAKRGFVGVSLMYRLSPKYQFPAQVEDVKAGIRYLKAHAKKYHLDPNKIIVRGGSAGGHLAAMLGVSAGHPYFNHHNLWPEYDDSVLGVINYSGPTSLFLTDWAARYKSLTQFLGNSTQQVPELAKAAMPISYVSDKSAQFFIVHGDNDTSVPIEMSREFVKALAKHNVKYQYYEIKGGSHKLSKSSPVEFKRLKKASYKFIEELVAD